MSRQGCRDIAIIGMSGRFPGANNLNEFKKNILEGKQCFRRVPRERWNSDAFFSKSIRMNDRTHTDMGAFIEDVFKFPAMHFSIPPARVAVMDPQQRLLLEVVRIALQDAGMESRLVRKNGELEALRNKTGVFIGNSISEFLNIQLARATAIQLAQGDFGRVDERGVDAILHSVENILPVSPFSMSGNLLNMAATNVSHQWGFGGPSFTMDAACAASLVAVQQAVECLRSGLCDCAVAGGVYLNLSPMNFLCFTRIGAMSLKGACRPFDAEADGFLQGEGCGVVILKRLEDAVADADRIHAVIRGAGVNNDGGKADGPMAPSRKGQAEAVQSAYMDAGIDISTVGYIECHATGTRRGDPVEVGALRDVLDNCGETGKPIRLGSIKGNVGHCMSAAGIASLLKTVLLIKNKQFPPQAGLERVNPALATDLDSRFTVPFSSETWEDHKYPRRAGVSSLGFGGTNCHIVVEEAPASNSRKSLPAVKISTDFELVFLSSPDRNLLARHCAEIAKAIEDLGQEADLGDIAFTLSVARKRERFGLAVVAAEVKDLVCKLETAASKLLADDFRLGELVPHGFLIDAETSAPEADKKEPPPTFAAMDERRKSLLTLAQRMDENSQAVLDGFYPREVHRLVSLPPTPLLRETYIPVQDVCTPVEPLDSWRKQPAKESLHNGSLVTADFPGAAAEHSTMTTNSGNGISSSPIADEMEGVTVRVLEAVSKVSAFPVSSLKKKQTLADDLGFDSMMMVELIEKLEKAIPELKQGLLQTVFDENTTISNVIDYIVNELNDSGGEKQASPEAEGANLPVWNTYRPVLLEQERSGLQSGFFPFEGWTLVAVDDPAIGDELAKRLEENGSRAILAVFHQEDSKEKNKIVWRERRASQPYESVSLNLSGISDLYALLAEKNISPSSVLFALGVCSPWDSTTDSFAGLTIAAQSLAAGLKRQTKKPEAFIAVTGMGGKLGLDHDSSEIKPMGAALVGFSKSLAREWPETLVKAVDIDPSVKPSQAAELVLAEIACADKDMEVGLTEKSRCVVGLKSIEKRTGNVISIAPESVIMMTGASVGIGAKIALELSIKYRCRLIIIGSRTLEDSEEAMQNIAKMRAAGAMVEYVKWDLTERTPPGSLREAASRLGEIRGLIHCAGIIRDGRVENKTPEDARRVMDVKFGGLIAALDFCGLDRLDFIMAFSSWAGRFGNIGQTDYAAANELMNRYLNQMSKHPGLKTASLLWPPWEDSAMTASIPGPVKRAMLARGVPFVSDSDGLSLFNSVLNSSVRGEILVGTGLPEQERILESAINLSLSAHPYLADHKINGRPVLPFASALNYIGLAAREQKGAADPLIIEDMQLHRGVVVEEAEKLRLTVRIRKGEESAQPEISAELSTPDAGSALAYSARIGFGPVAFDEFAEFDDPPGSYSKPAPNFFDPTWMELEDFYEQHSFHGPRMRAIEKIERLEENLIAGVVKTSAPADWMPDSKEKTWAIDPMVVDGSFQLAAYWLAAKHDRRGYPLSFSRFVLYRPFSGKAVRCIIKASGNSADGFAGDIKYIGEEGELLAAMTDVRVRLLQPSTEAKASDAAEKNHSIKSNFYKIEELPEICEFRARLKAVESAGFVNPYFIPQEGVAADTTVMGGKEFINYSSYNYLGFSGDPEIGAAAKEAIDRFGTSVSASRLASGERPLHGELEALIAALLKTEAALVFSAGHATNESVIGHLMGEGDLIIHDSLAHNSIQQGAALSGARRRPFPHNDWKALDELLSKLRPQFNKCLVAIEGVYSMDGDIPDLPMFVEIKEKHSCLLYVDEAHSIGVLGKGAGIREHFGVNAEKIDLWMGTLSKSFASCGGYIAGKSALIEYLKYTTPGFVFSAGITPANAGAAIAAIKKMGDNPGIVAKLQTQSEKFLELAKKKGIDTGLSRGSAIVPCITGDSQKAMALSHRLALKGINVQPIVYPAVEEEAARLRFFLSARHTDEQIRQTVETLDAELRGL